MASRDENGVVLYADPEHSGLRFAVISSLILGMLFSFFIVRNLLPVLLPGSGLLDYLWVISCVAALPLGLALAWVIEAALKQRWHSGHRLVLTGDAIRYEGPGKSAEPWDQAGNATIAWSQRTNVACWSFRLKGYPRSGRERRLSDRWQCLACELQQDERRLVVFSYLPPEDASRWLEDRSLREPFRQISHAELYEATGKGDWKKGTLPEIPTHLLAGADGRYWLAERRRWQSGLELQPEDFALFMNDIDQHRASADLSPSDDFSEVS